MFKLNAASRLTAMHEVHADPFEGWINSLQFTYDRPEGKNYVTVDATPTEVVTKLRSDGWTSKGKGLYTKGEHSCLISRDGNKARITDRK
jgi:hypothetical protein